MKLLDKLEALFINQPKRTTDEYPSLFDRLRNVFYDAEFLKADLQRIPPLCRCEDAIAHLEGRCSCTKTPVNPPAEVADRKGCLARLETLHLDIKSLRESLQRHTKDLEPEEQTEELKRELSLIEDFAERLGATVEKISIHAAEFEANCSNDALQRLKESSSEIDKYSTEFFWSLLKHDGDQKAKPSSQTARV
jgi:hypothetical protein